MKEKKTDPTIESAFDYCSKIALEHYENFPVGSWIVPKDKRKYVHAIYTFARTADDFADEKKYREEERFHLLEDWENKLRSCVIDNPDEHVFIALRETIRKFDIPVELLGDLISAFKLDLINKRYKSRKDLLSYCRYSANPVGRIVLFLFGYKDPELHRLSDFICTALQLTNFWQDISIDLEKDRIYLPAEDMERFGYYEKDLRSHQLNSSFINLLRYEIEFTRGLFEEGLPLCNRVGKRLSLELKAVRSGGMKILEKIEKNGYDVFNNMPVINIFDKAKILSKTLVMG